MAPTLVEEYNEFAPPSSPSRLDRVKSLTRKVKSATKNFVHEGTDHGNADDRDEDKDEDDLFEDPAFNPQKTLNPGPDRADSVRNRLQRGAHAAVEAAKHPRRAVADNYTRKFAANISKQHHDYAGDLDTALVDAHDALSKAETTSITDLQHGQPEYYIRHKVGEIDNAQHRIEQIDEQREDLRSAWVIGRHVKRVKVIRQMSRKPLRSDFLATQGPEENSPSQWSSYLGHLTLWYTRQFTAQHIDDFENPPFDLTELAGTAERFTIISTPWQSFVMDIRNIYMWREPGRTTGFMLLFWVLWYFQQIVTFAFASAIYVTVYNKISPASVQNIRERLKRVEDEKSKAQAWTELIQKHGKQDWIEPLLDNLGPLIQLQLEDLTGFLEVLQNFYNWERPRKTMATLFLLTTCLFFILLADIETCIRLLWAGIGSIFFFSFPIATNYPKYRHIVNPIYWAFWDIPNTAELAIAQLQEKVILRDAQRLDQFVTDSSISYERSHTSPLDYLSDTSSESDYSSESRPRSSFEDALLSRPLSSIGSSIQPSHLQALRLFQSQEHHTFRAVILQSQIHSRITLLRTGFWIYNKSECQFHPYTNLTEMQKFDLATNTDNNYASRPRRKAQKFKKMIERWKTLQTVPSGLAFIFYPGDTIQQQQPPDPGDHPSMSSSPITSDVRSSNQNMDDNNEASGPPFPKLQAVMTEPEARRTQDYAHAPKSDRRQLEVMVAEADRDKIFSLVLGWSNLKWKPLFSMDRQNKMGHRDGHEGAGNGNLDEAIKKVFGM